MGLREDFMALWKFPDNSCYAHQVSAKVRFPLWVKLVSIITILMFFSLGLITVFIALFVSSDVLKTARENNLSINEMSAQTTANILGSIRSNTQTLLQDISLIFPDRASAQNGNADGGADASEPLWDFFFLQNSDVICVAMRDSASKKNAPQFFLNKKNASSQILSDDALNNFSSFSNFFNDNAHLLNRSFIGDTLLFNVSALFDGLPVLAMSFPQGDFSSAIVFFNSQTITEMFGTGATSTFVINYAGDILIAADQELIRNEANLSSDYFFNESLKRDSISIVDRYTDKTGRNFLGNARRLEDFNAVVISTIPSDVVFEGISATTRRNIFLSLFVWFLGVLFLWFFAKSISGPLQELRDAAKSIEDGDYRIALTQRSKDETGVLMQSVMQMSNVLSNFEKFTNKTLARVASQRRLATGGEIKQATIFFSDIRAFTAISETMSPADVVKFLNAYMERMVACVISTGGVIDKFIGDAVMAHWGAVESAGSAELDALNGVSAALMMRASLWCYNHTERGSPKRPTIRIGCGLNTGLAVAGQIGSSRRVVFTVIGDEVSLADRTETLNKPFATEILITENTYKLVEKYLIAEKMGTITDKGKKIDIYAVINMKDSEESKLMLERLEKIPKNDITICKRYVGPAGPQTLAELRELLNIPTPDLSHLNLDEEEKKYSVKQNDEKQSA
jgi:adenylate cyclase